MRRCWELSKTETCFICMQCTNCSPCSCKEGGKKECFRNEWMNLGTIFQWESLFSLSHDTKGDANEREFCCYHRLLRVNILPYSFLIYPLLCLHSRKHFFIRPWRKKDTHSLSLSAVSDGIERWRLFCLKKLVLLFHRSSNKKSDTVIQNKRRSQLSISPKTHSRLLFPTLITISRDTCYCCSTIESTLELNNKHLDSSWVVQWKIPWNWSIFDYSFIYSFIRLDFSPLFSSESIDGNRKQEKDLLVVLFTPTFDWMIRSNSSCSRGSKIFYPPVRSTFQINTSSNIIAPNGFFSFQT